MLTAIGWNKSQVSPREAVAYGAAAGFAGTIVLGVTVKDASVRLDPQQMDRWENTYPVRIIAGDGVTLAGMLGHFKGFADLWQQHHLWAPVIALHGKPTFLMGRAEDPDYEAHLREGKYFLIDDAALDTREIQESFLFQAAP